MYHTNESVYDSPVMQLSKAVGKPNLSFSERMHLISSAECEAMTLLELPQIGKVVVNWSVLNPNPDRFAITLYYKLKPESPLPDAVTTTWFGGKIPHVSSIHVCRYTRRYYPEMRQRMLKALAFFKNYNEEDKVYLEVRKQVQRSWDKLEFELTRPNSGS